MVFKAVAGNHHSVYEDYMHLGNINTHIPYASAVSSPLVYRDGEVLDRWDHIIVPKVCNQAAFRPALYLSSFKQFVRK